MTENSEHHNQQPKRFRFPLRCRLKKNSRFQTVFQKRLCRSDGQLIVYACPNRKDHSRIGLAVGKKLGNAVKRNRYKRSLREAFRLERQNLPIGFDYVLIPRHAQKISTRRFQNSLLRLCSALTSPPNTKKKRENNA